MSAKKKIAVLFGGRSVEHEISVISALQAIEAMDVLKYEIIPVYIALSGAWYTGDALLKREFYKNLPASFSNVDHVYLSPEPGVGGLIKKGGKGFFSAKEEVIPVDVYLPVFHGQYGEDGCVQGLFELANVPYAGSPVLASAAAMNKYICKAILEHHGIPVLPAVTVSKKDAQRDITKVCEEITKSTGLQEFPLFVKPGNLGSSVGVSKASNQIELQAALAKVFQFDQEAIIEPCITRLLEINVSIIESESGPQVSVVEIPVASAEFLSYEDKYMRNGKGKKGKASSSSAQGMASLTRVIDPQDLDPEYKRLVCSYAAEAFTILSCAGVVRFDFMVDLEKGELYFNELNMIPGSLSFYLWDRVKPPLLLSDIMDRLIEGAERRFSEKSQLKRDFGFKVLGA